MVKRTFNPVRATVMCRCSVDTILSQQSGWLHNGVTFSWFMTASTLYRLSLPFRFLGLLYSCGLHGCYTTSHLTAVTLIHTAISLKRAGLYEYHSLRLVWLTNGFPPPPPSPFSPSGFPMHVAGLGLRSRQQTLILSHFTVNSSERGKSFWCCCCCLFVLYKYRASKHCPIC